MLDALSKREREILGCMLDHGTGKQIAGQFGISPRTVEAHRANPMARLDVPIASQAIRLAIEGEAYAAPAALHVQAFDRSRDARIALPILQ
ncbi:LuxR C-terminal-related transcriptional regulator [Qipengyuania mesophila]|uniref:LuxR C-terminal-related transcriptional regulator n=1 Tax=Qipengyuania mesophila TaxID=2867246 RepID=UPI00351693F0